MPGCGTGDGSTLMPLGMGTIIHVASGDSAKAIDVGIAKQQIRSDNLIINPAPFFYRLANFPVTL